MRLPRLIRPDTTAFYNICARVVDGLFKFDTAFKEEMYKILCDVADFCGVAIVDFGVMTNHFHIEAMVLPKATFVDDEEVIRRVGRLYGEKTRLDLEQSVDALRANGRGGVLPLNCFRKRLYKPCSALWTLTQACADTVKHSFL